MKFLLVFLSLAALGTAAASDLDFTLVNQTGRSFEAVYITSTSDKDWDGNLLPNGKVLAAGGELKVDFDRKAKSPTWDLNFVDADGLSEQFDHVNLAHADKVILKVIKGKITAEVE